MKTMLPLLLLMTVVGCAPKTRSYASSYRSSQTSTPPSAQWTDEQKLVFRYEIRDGAAALNSARVILVFDEITPKQQQVFHFQGNQQAVPIAGDGICSVSVTCNNGQAMVGFRSDYAQGTNTLQFGQETARLVQGGRLLLAGNQAVDLTKGKRVVHLKRGAVKVE